MDTYGLIGYPLSHSFSAKFFNKKFKNEQIDAQYLNFEIDEIDKIKKIIVDYPHLKGLNVTIPYKEEIIPLLHALSPEAEAIGAVNVIKIESNPHNSSIQLIGHNSDYFGFIQSLLPLLSVDIHTKALVLGTGGASKAICKALSDLNITYQLISRTKTDKTLTYQELNEKIVKEHKIIINTTPVGTFPKIYDYPDIPYQYITNNHILYDLIYNPAETLFLKKGKEQSATIKNGYDMLIRQAIRAWHIWQS